MSSVFLKTSNEEDSTVSLRSLFHCPTVLTVGQLVLRFSLHLLCYSLSPLLHVLPSTERENSYSPFPLWQLFKYLKTATISSLHLLIPSKLNIPYSLSLSSYTFLIALLSLSFVFRSSPVSLYPSCNVEHQTAQKTLAEVQRAPSRVITTQDLNTVLSGP